MFGFHKKYFLLALLLFVVEVLIAIYLHDGFIRSYVGDFLVVILLYCFFKTFLTASVLSIALPVLLFAYLIETTQYFHVVNRLHFQNNPVIRTIIGSSFEWSDILAYTLGIIMVLFAEKWKMIIKRRAGL